MALRKSGQYSYNFNARENDLCSVVNNPVDILEDLEAYLSEFGLKVNIKFTFINRPYTLWISTTQNVLQDCLNIEKRLLRPPMESLPAPRITCLPLVVKSSLGY